MMKAMMAQQTSLTYGLAGLPHNHWVLAERHQNQLLDSCLLFGDQLTVCTVLGNAPWQ